MKMKFSKYLLMHYFSFLASRLKLATLIGVFCLTHCTSLAAQEDINFYLSNSTLLDKKTFISLQDVFDKAELGHIKVSNTDFWHPYVQGIRDGRRGLYFAPPHLSAWAIKKHQFTPLLKLAGKLQYVLLSRRNDISIFEVNDLAGKRICTSKAPNLGFILANSALKKSLNSPLIISKNAASHAFLRDDKDCNAFVVSEHLFIENALKKPDQFIRLQQGEKYQNHVYISSNDIDKETQLKFKRVMSSRQVMSLLKPLYTEYSNRPVLLDAKESDYRKTHNDYLQRVWAK